MSATSERVIHCLAFGHGRTVAEVLERLGKARVTVDETQVEAALVELLEAGLVVEVGRGLWQRT